MEADLILKADGYLGETSTLGGTALGTPTHFTFQAVFDPTLDLEPAIDYGIFATRITFQIDGYGTFVGAIDPGVYVALQKLDPAVYGFDGYGVGLLNAPASSASGGFLTTATGPNSPLDVNAPTATTFGGGGGGGDYAPFTVHFLGASGDLVFNTYACHALPSVYLVSVPEPSSLVCLGIGGLVLLRPLYRRQQRAA